MNVSLVIVCLGIMGKGMLGILLAILALWMAVAGLNRLTRPK
mgnify:CR=1 FL=1|nr:hypothetical protein [uncultured Acetatifactor sp.]